MVGRCGWSHFVRNGVLNKKYLGGKVKYKMSDKMAITYVVAIYKLFHPGCHQIAKLLIHLKLNFFSLTSLNKHPKLSTLRCLYPLHNLSHPLPLPKILVSSSTQPFPFLSRSPPFQVPVTTIYVIFGASATL